MKNTTGVIVARFQTNRLTPGHVHLLNTALLQNDTVLLFLGCSPLKNSVSDPINFYWRSAMVQSDNRLFRQGKRLIIQPINDRGNDGVWSNALRAEISIHADSNSEIRLYGSRDSSFLKAFDSEYEKVELIPFSDFSATEHRAQIARSYPSGRDEDDHIRAGMIIAANERFPMVVSTVDVAILEPKDGVMGVWLGRKHAGTQFRFIGGFTEPNSPNDEADALREAKEETGLELGQLAYIGNTLIDDWRFAKSPDKIRTRFFAGRVVSGDAKGADDIAEVKWVPIEDLKGNELVSEHGPLLDMFIDWTYTPAAQKYLETL